MLPIIHENTQMNYTEKDSLKVLMKDYDTLRGTITHFVSTYCKMMKKTDDKAKFSKSNTVLVVRSIDKCIYKFMQKHEDCDVYFKKVTSMNRIMLNTTNDKNKLRMISKLLKVKC